MDTPLRLLRAIAEDMAPTRLTARQQARHDRILDVARHLMARFGPASLTERDLACALRIGTATLRWHFVDLHALLSAIICGHLAGLHTALSALSSRAPDCQQRRRALARSCLGTVAGREVLCLLTEHAASLPEDERAFVATALTRVETLLGCTLAASAPPARPALAASPRPPAPPAAQQKPVRQPGATQPPVAPAPGSTAIVSAPQQPSANRLPWPTGACPAAPALPQPRRQLSPPASMPPNIAIAEATARAVANVRLRALP